MAGWLHFQYAADCRAANPTYGYAASYGCNNNWGNIGTSTPADFSQIGSATWSKYCYQRVFASPPPAAPSPPPHPPLLPPSPPPPATNPSPPEVYSYQIVQSGTCASAGGESISSGLAACTAAGAELSIAARWNMEYDSPHVPSGCIVTSTGSALYFNPRDSSKACGAQTSSTWHCVCRFTTAYSPSPPQPPYTFTGTASLKTAVQAFNDDSLAATKEYGPIADWDVSAVTDMSGLFGEDGRGLANFNADISSWDTSGVTTMRYMFVVRPARALTPQPSVGTRPALACAIAAPRP